MKHRRIITMLMAVFGVAAMSGLFAQDAAAPAAGVEVKAPAAEVVAPAAATPVVDAPKAEPAAAAAPAEVVAPVAAGEEKKADAKAELITMTVSDAKIQDVLRSLAAMRPGSNIIMGPDVQGNVSFALKDVTWEMALQLVTESNGFQVSKESDNVFRVHKPEAKPKQDIIIEVMTKSDIPGLSAEDALRLVGAGRGGLDVDAAQAKKIVEAAPGSYLKSLQVDNQPAIAVVNALAKKAGLNFAFSADLGGLAGAPAAGAPPAPVAAPGPMSVTPPISLNLRNISVIDAILLVAEQGALSCTQQNNVWVVKPMPPAQLQQEPLKVATFEVKYLVLDEDFIKMCQKLLSARGTVTAGKNKILVVRDTAEGIASIEGMLKVMDKPTPQVVIEARFFELQDGDSRNIGIDWSFLGEAGLGITIDPITMAYNKERTLLQTTQGQLNDSSVATTITNGVVDTVRTDTTTFPGVTADSRSKSITDTRAAILDVSQFGVVLHALEENSDARQLSNPKIVVSSDQQATIHIGEQTPIIKSSASSAGVGTIQTYELDGDYGGETTEEESLIPGKPGTSKTKFKTNKGYLDLGTKLTVSPSVKTEDQIYIIVVPELTSLIRYETFGSGTSVQRYPVLFNTQVRTQFTIRSGQTIAIGGLVNERMSKTQSAVPVIGYIPGLKKLFSYETETRQNAETIIFLTVKIVPGETLLPTSGVPTRAYLVQPELERIQIEDAAGAEYSPKAAREKLLQKEKAKEKKGVFSKEYWQKDPPKNEAVPAPVTPAVKPAAPAAPDADSAATAAPPPAASAETPAAPAAAAPGK